MGGAELLLMNICMAFSNGINNANCNETHPKVPEEYSLFNKMPPQIKRPMPPEIRITTLEDMPLSGTTMKDGKLVGTGHAFYILGLLQEKLNFNYKIIKPKDNVYGDKNSGIFGQLYKGEVDLAVAFIPVMHEARSMLKYSTAMDQAEWTIMMKRPQESATGSGLLAPFDTNVWLLILLSLIVVGPIIYILIFIRSKLCKVGEPGNFTLPTCMWFVYGALLKQGSTLSPVTDSARMLFATWWIFITILTSFYTANLTAFLTLSEFTLPIKSVGDLVQKNQKWFAQEGRAIDWIANQHNDELDMLKFSIDKSIGEIINLDGKSSTEILDYVTRNKMFLRERPIVESLIFMDYVNKTRHGIEESKRCTYVIMPGSILIKSRAFGFPPNSTIDAIIDQKLLSLVESGIIKYSTAAELPGTQICPLNLGSKDRQLRNADLSMTYKVIGVGFTIAVAAFLGEVVYRWCKCKPKQKGSWMDDGKSRPELPIYSFKPPDFMKRSPPPLYNNINTEAYTKKHFINGRDYYVVTEKDGDKRLVPVRTPSAFLFQYAA